MLDGCIVTVSSRLEQLQINGARIVTGRPVFTSIRSLYMYYETGWETLADRRKRRKLILMYKIIKCNAPSYLTDFLPNRVKETNGYNLRNRNDFEVSFYRLCSYESSFFPTTLKLWNYREMGIRMLQSLWQSKSNIETVPEKIAKYTTAHDRKYNIILTRFRNSCSSLKADLYNILQIPAVVADFHFKAPSVTFLNMVITISKGTERSITCERTQLTLIVRKTLMTVPKKL